MSWADNVACTEERRVAYNVLVGKPGGRRPLGRFRHRWEYNIKMNLREVG
jgi:hypothetical protein